MREKLAAHQEEPSCAGCHTLMDNIGLALENFDGIGAFRTTENGAIDAEYKAEYMVERTDILRSRLAKRDASANQHRQVLPPGGTRKNGLIPQSRPGVNSNTDSKLCGRW